MPYFRNVECHAENRLRAVAHLRDREASVGLVGLNDLEDAAHSHSEAGRDGFVRRGFLPPRRWLLG